MNVDSQEVSKRIVITRRKENQEKSCLRTQLPSLGRNLLEFFWICNVLPPPPVSSPKHLKLQSSSESPETRGECSEKGVSFFRSGSKEAWQRDLK